VPQQFSRVPADLSVYNESVYYEYTEFISKNNQHRFKDQVENKQTKSFAMPGSERCLVKLLDLYLSKLVPNSEHFYMRPLPHITIDGQPWYRRQRVGINAIKRFVSKLCHDSGIDSAHTSHSLRATSICIIRIFQRK